MSSEAKTTMSAKETADYIGISYWLVLDMAKRNQIPHIKTGDRTLFRKQTIDTWMNEQEAQSVKPVERFGMVRKIGV